ncbi:MAG: dihydrofolate reductase [Bdellovibrionales bacterium]
MTASVSISLIAAVAKNGAVGRNGALLWNLQEDLQRFKLLTIGKPVIMGRKTWLALDKPLPERLNIVMTSQPDFTATGATVVHSYEEAVAHAIPLAVQGFGEIMVIGGAAAYEAALNGPEPLRAQKMYLTEVDDIPDDADAFFPKFNKDEWQVTQTLPRQGPPPFAFVDYVRKEEKKEQAA